MVVQEYMADGVIFSVEIPGLDDTYPSKNDCTTFILESTLQCLFRSDNGDEIAELTFLNETKGACLVHADCHSSLANVSIAMQTGVASMILSSYQVSDIASDNI